MTVAGECSFRMPLHGQDVMPGQRALQGFNDAVIGTAGSDAEPIPNDVCRLVVA